MNKKQWKTFSIVLCFLLLITTFLSKPIFAAGFDNCNVNVINDYTFIPKNLIVQYEKSTKGIVVECIIKDMSELKDILYSDNYQIIVNNPM